MVCLSSGSETACVFSSAAALGSLLTWEKSNCLRENKNKNEMRHTLAGEGRTLRRGSALDGVDAQAGRCARRQRSMRTAPGRVGEAMRLLSLSLSLPRPPPRSLRSAWHFMTYGWREREGEWESERSPRRSRDSGLPASPHLLKHDFQPSDPLSEPRPERKWVFFPLKMQMPLAQRRRRRCRLGRAGLWPSFFSH